MKSWVIIILDRSGSMASIREATVQGINEFVAKVNSEPGDTDWTLIQFDDHASAKGAMEEFPLVSFDRLSDKELVNGFHLEFNPRGGTALQDALGISLNRIKDQWFEIPKEDRPRVMVVVMTDGEENSSNIYSSDQIRELTAKCQALPHWEFLYLGANQDEFLASRSVGLYHAPVGHMHQNALPFENTSRAVLQCMASGSVGVAAWKAGGSYLSGSLQLSDGTVTTNQYAGLSLSGHVPPVNMTTSSITAESSKVTP